MAGHDHDPLPTSTSSRTSSSTPSAVAASALTPIILKSASSSDDGDNNNNATPAGVVLVCRHHGSSRKRRALSSSVDVAKAIAVIGMEDKEVSGGEEEECETDVDDQASEEEEEGRDLRTSSSFRFDRDGDGDGDGEEETKAASASSSLLVSRVGAKIRRLNLTQVDEEGCRAPHNSPVEKRRAVTLRPALGGDDDNDKRGDRSPPSGLFAVGREGGLRTEEKLHTRLLFDDGGTVEKMWMDDVSPRDVVNFPSFANFDSPPSHELVVRGGEVGGDDTDADRSYRNYDDMENNFIDPHPPPLTTRKGKARRRILDDDDDGSNEYRMAIRNDNCRSSPLPRPQGLRTIGRASSFLQMFSCSSYDMIVEGEMSKNGDHGSVDTKNDVYDDFIRKPESNVHGNMVFGMSSPLRPIRYKNHRRYTPASPTTGDDVTDDKCKAATSSFSRFVSDFEIVGTLGDGSFGSVYSVRNRTDRRLYAIKAAKREARGSSDRDRMLQEVFALSSLSDKGCLNSMHIVRYHQAWMEGNRLYIQTELCDGTLLGQMRYGSMIDERGRYTLLREILLALKLVHESGMIHLDIKPENIFIKNGQYKLGDFGLVSKIENHEDVEEGDSRYMSLELLRGELDDLTKSDIYSLGVTMYEICLGRSEKLPENGQEWQDIRNGILQTMPNTAIELQMIVREMMAPEWITRPSADALLKRRQLLSDEQQQLIVERNKTNVANMALDAQKERFNALSPRPGRLPRSNTIC